VHVHTIDTGVAVPAIANHPVPEYLTDRSPGTGALAPRSALHSDAPRLDLNGEWRFRLQPTAAFDGDDESPREDYDDGGWDRIVVPSSWVLDPAGRWGRPIYTNVQFPFPIDAPSVPDENPTGEYRRTVDVPDDLAADGRAVLRFDGVESAYRVWWNGEPVGVGKGSRLAHEFDVSDLIRPGANTLMVRVHQWSDASYLEDQDQWWLPGIFRDVTLLSRPDAGLDDVWLRTAWRDGAGRLDPEITAADSAFPVRLTIDELDLEIEWVSPAEVAPVEVGEVEPWSAERPRLYTAVVSTRAERVTQRIGFRTVEIVGDRLLANGARLVFHGMNRHEAHPERGRVFDESHAREDLARMKRFNVNAIRTSHYPPHPRLLDLADELGFWVVLECDLETHGFEYVSSQHGTSQTEVTERMHRLIERDRNHAAPGHAPWTQNPSDDLAWRDAYLDRMRRTVERDKNHASVVLWSLGNEAGTGVNLAAMAAWARSRDPHRPIHYEGDYSGAYTDVYSRMYASVPETESIGSDDTSLLLGCSAAESARQRSKPFIQCEYVHAMGNGPGGIAQYEEVVDRLHRLHGGFVWEWRDHGILSNTAEGIPYYAYGGDFGEVVHDGNFVMDGMVLSDDTPTPGLVEFAAVAGPFRITFADGGIHLLSRRHSRGTDDVEFVWRAEADGREIASGRLEGVELAAGEERAFGVPEVPTADGEIWLTVEARTRETTGWAPAGHVLASGQLRLRAPRVAERPAGSARPAGPASTARGIDPTVARFDGGRLVELAGMEALAPELDLFRAPTDNDSGASAGSYDLADPVRFPVGVPAPPVAELWRRSGLDRLTSRLLESSVDASGIREVRRWAPANAREYVLTDTSWSAVDGGVRLRVDILPSSGWDIVWPRMGVRIGLPLGLDEAEWFGLGPNEAYPDSLSAARVGRFTSPVDDLVVPYARPQESGHRPGLRELLVTGDAGALRVVAVPDGRGRLPGFTLRRHTPQEVAAAGHPHELPEPRRTWLTIDAAQHGLGSRACGPDVWPDAALRPEARSIEVIFSRP
jgi:beta-galactosidase